MTHYRYSKTDIPEERKTLKKIPVHRILTYITQGTLTLTDRRQKKKNKKKKHKHLIIKINIRQKQTLLFCVVILCLKFLFCVSMRNVHK
jgi:hypothetical protein